MARKQEAEAEERLGLSPLQAAVAALDVATLLTKAGSATVEDMYRLAAELPADPDEAVSGTRSCLMTCASRLEDAAGLLEAQRQHLAWLADHANQAR